MILGIFILFNLLVFIAGASNGLMDLIHFHWSEAPEFMKKKPIFWNPKESWKNKNRHKNKVVRLLFRTILVSMTDGWHLLKFIMKSCIALASSFYVFVPMDFIGLAIPFGFAMFYIAFQFGFKSTYK